MLCLLEIGPVALEKKIFKSVLSIITMWLHSLLEKAVVLHLNNFEFPYPMMLISKFGLNGLE